MCYRNNPLYSALEDLGDSLTREIISYIGQGRYDALPDEKNKIPTSQELEEQFKLNIGDNNGKRFKNQSP
jgi:hypothetical protein